MEFLFTLGEGCITSPDLRVRAPLLFRSYFEMDFLMAALYLQSMNIFQQSFDS
jgi:hypothetical protein